MSQNILEKPPLNRVSNWFWAGAVTLAIIGGAWGLNQDVAPPVPDQHADIIAVQKIAEAMLIKQKQGGDPFDGVVIPDGTLNGILLPMDNSKKDTNPDPDALELRRDNKDGTETTIVASITGDENLNTTATLVIDRSMILNQNPDDIPEQQKRNIKITVDPDMNVLEKIYEEESYTVSMSTTANAPCGVPDSQRLAPLLYSGILPHTLGAESTPTSQEAIQDHSDMSLQALVRRFYERYVNSNPQATNTGVLVAYPHPSGSLVLQLSTTNIYHRADNAYNRYEYLGQGPFSIEQPEQSFRYARSRINGTSTTVAACRFVNGQAESGKPPQWTLYQRILRALRSFW